MLEAQVAFETSFKIRRHYRKYPKHVCQVTYCCIWIAPNKMHRIVFDSVECELIHFAISFKQQEMNNARDISRITKKAFGTLSILLVRSALSVWT